MNEIEHTEEELASENAFRRSGIPQPNFVDLERQVKRHGPEGVMESALHLSLQEYESLQAICGHAAPLPGRRMRMPRDR